MGCRCVLLVMLAACSFDARVTSEPPDAEVDAMVDAAIDAPITACGSCDDADPCTADSCVNMQCVNTLYVVPAGCGGTLQRCAGQSTCYLHCTTARIWDNAEQLCDSWAGHLVTITSDPENTCVDTWLPAQGWIGYFQDAADVEPDMGWEWISTQTSSYTKWFPQQPNNPIDILPEGQDCAYSDGAQTGQWYDHECTQPYPYVCER